MVNILRLQDPLQIKARTCRVFVFYPASLLQSFLDVRITSSTDEYFGLIIHSVLLFPCGEICNVGEHCPLWVVPLNEVINWIILLLLFLGLFFTILRHLLLILQILQAWLVVHFFKVLLCLLTSLLYLFVLFLLFFFSFCFFNLFPLL